MLKAKSAEDAIRAELRQYWITCFAWEPSPSVVTMLFNRLDRIPMAEMQLLVDACARKYAEQIQERYPDYPPLWICRKAERYMGGILRNVLERKAENVQQAV